MKEKISILLNLIACLVMLLAISSQAKAQQNVHPQSGKYEWPTDPPVKAKL